VFVSAEDSCNRRSE